ncbi:MAG: glycosyltransferase, partial [Acidobacteria bacterium]|nr:glycosyltransferase [Acidobacteriota bacterium]NIO59599.1 glycosyltransferase [Acidobacteriota bacterium]NIT11305.1 glycosyltransferase [Acidobacteriota bacterium]
RKGQRRLLEAASVIAEQGRDVRVVLVGKGRQERALRRKAAALGVAVDFHVDVPWAELPERYAEFDVFAMPCKSRWFGLEVEGLGIVFLEASASAIPVVAGDSGGAPETVIEGSTGFVVHDTDGLVRALERLADAPELRASMGAAGRAFVESQWTWDQVAARLSSGLHEVVGSG